MENLNSGYQQHSSFMKEIEDLNSNIREVVDKVSQQQRNSYTDSFLNYLAIVPDFNLPESSMLVGN